VPLGFFFRDLSALHVDGLVAIQGGWGDAVNDLQRARVPDNLRGRRKELGVQGEELVRVRVSPEREAIYAPDDLERLLECGDDIRTTETIGSSGDAWDLGVLLVS
jgi:hypothetical protein